MEKWLQKIALNWKKYIFIFILGVFCFMTVIHVLYKMRTGIYWLEAEWSAGDILSFSGTILSFIGTIVLGCVATKVSIDNNSINARLVEIENKREILEKEHRLGCILPDQIEIQYYKYVSERDASGQKGYYFTKCSKFEDTLDNMYFRIIMKFTSKSIINTLTRKSIKVCERGFDDDIENGISDFIWKPFYVDENDTTRSINQKDNTFEDGFVFSVSSKEPENLDKIKNIFKRKKEYLLCVEYEYINVIKEKRKIILHITCRNENMLKTEIVSIE